MANVTINEVVYRVLEINRGVRGAPGAAGLSTVTAAEALGGHRAVTWSGGYLDQTNLDEYAGITVSALTLGEEGTVQRTGVLTDTSFSFTVGLPIFALSSGVLVQAYSVLPIRRLGVAVSATSINLDPQPTIGS